MRAIILTLFLGTSLGLMAQNDYVQWSVDFLQDLKAGKKTDAHVAKFAKIDAADFQKQIDTDAEKLAFWMNFYNGMIQHILKAKPELYEDRGAFFTEKRVTFAGTEVSFDMMEHGVLRRGVSKYSKGYFENPFGSDWHEDYEVSEIDWRIHFALNCGAADCPPVRIYRDERVYEQLNLSAMAYMKAQVRYDEAKDEVYVPALMNWFSGDFGGSDGVLNILREYKQIPKSADPDIEYKDYDWTLKLGTFYKD